MSFIWIKCKNYTPKPYEGDYREMVESLWSLKYHLHTVGTNKSERKDYVLDHARKIRLKNGKWMFHGSESSHDEYVKKFKELAEIGSIRLMKYSKLEKGRSPIYIVYVDDFDDEEEVRNTFNLLINEFGEKRTYYFKPDIYTLMDIYAKDKKLLTPHIYMSKGADYVESE